MPTVKEVIEHLSRYNPDEHIAAALWSEGDVLGRAEELEISITRGEAQDILDKMDHGHDASIGITWDTIDGYLEDLPKKDEETEDYLYRNVFDPYQASSYKGTGHTN